MTVTRKPSRKVIEARRAAREGRTLRAVIYCRVSQDTGKRGRSVAEQLTVCEREAERNGWSVVATLTDNDVGASTFSKGERPQWLEAKELLASGAADVLVTWESSRAQRDLGAYVALRDLCVEVGALWSYSGDVYDMSDPDDAARTGQDALDAEREAGRTSKRVLRATAANATAGKPCGIVPFGYRRTYADGESTQLVDSVTGPIVVDMIHRVLNGEGLLTIANDLNGRGVFSTRGNPWSSVTVRQLVSNPAYAALRVHRGEVVGPGQWPSLVDVETHARVVALLGNPARRVQTHNNRAHLLSGVARCGRCGSVLYVNTTSGRARYTCKAGQCVVFEKVALETIVEAAVLALFRKGDALDALDVPDTPDTINRRVEIERLEGVKADARRGLVRGTTTQESFELIEHECNFEIAAHAKVLGGSARPVPAVVRAMNASVDVGVYWSGLSVDDRSTIVRTAFHVTVNAATRPGSHVVDLGRVVVVKALA